MLIIVHLICPFYLDGSGTEVCWIRQKAERWTREFVVIQVWVIWRKPPEPWAGAGGRAGRAGEDLNPLHTKVRVCCLAERRQELH